MRRIIIVLTVALILPAIAVAEKAGPGTTAVTQANATITDLLKQKAEPGSPAEKALATKVTTAVRSFLDIDELGRAAMVNQWSKLKPAEQTEFLTVLRDLIEANYIKGLRANVSYTVAYKGETTDPKGNLVVDTEVGAQRKGRPFKIRIEYVLAKHGGSLKVFDIKTDGVGLVENYRSMFDKIIKDKGFAGLIGAMKTKLAQIQAAPSPAAPAPPPAKT